MIGIEATAGRTGPKSIRDFEVIVKALAFDLCEQEVVLGFGAVQRHCCFQKSLHLVSDSIERIKIRVLWEGRSIEICKEAIGDSAHGGTDSLSILSLPQTSSGLRFSP